MKIGIIGAGNIGATVARLFVNSGHEVAISNSRGPASLQPLVKELGRRELPRPGQCLAVRQQLGSFDCRWRQLHQRQQQQVFRQCQQWSAAERQHDNPLI